jgi:hypothetical protein
MNQRLKSILKKWGIKMSSIRKYKVEFDWNGSPFSPVEEPFNASFTTIVEWSERIVDRQRLLTQAIKQYGKPFPRSYASRITELPDEQELKDKVELQEKEIAMLKDELKETTLKLKIHQSTDVNETVHLQRELLEFYQSKRK